MRGQERSRPIVVCPAAAVAGCPGGAAQLQLCRPVGGCSQCVAAQQGVRRWLLSAAADAPLGSSADKGAQKGHKADLRKGTRFRTNASRHQSAVRTCRTLGTAQPLACGIARWKDRRDTSAAVLVRSVLLRASSSSAVLATRPFLSHRNNSQPIGFGCDDGPRGIACVWSSDGGRQRLEYSWRGRGRHHHQASHGQLAQHLAAFVEAEEVWRAG